MLRDTLWTLLRNYVIELFNDKSLFMLRNNLIWGWICWTIIRSHVIKHISRFHIQYNDKWYNILLFRINPIVIYYCFFRFGIGYSFYTSAGICGFVFGLYKRWIRPSLIYTLFSKITKSCLECVNQNIPKPYAFVSTPLQSNLSLWVSLIFKNEFANSLLNKYPDVTNVLIEIHVIETPVSHCYIS